MRKFGAAKPPVARELLPENAASQPHRRRLALAVLVGIR
jgi:hypothetical protein